MTDEPLPVPTPLVEIKPFTLYEPPFALHDTYSVPLVPIGVAWWRIVDANGAPVTAIMFSIPDPEPTSPGYADYIEVQRICAQAIANALTAVTLEAKPHLPLDI